MRRLTAWRSILRGIFLAVCFALACAFVPGAALAQHVGGRTSGPVGAPGMGGAPHVNGPIVSGPQVNGPHVIEAPAVGVRENAPRGIGTPRIARRPFIPFRPVFPIFPPHRYWFWGAPLYGYGLGFGFSPFWWDSCGAYWIWAWGYNCYAANFYVSVGAGRELQQLYLKDGAVYDVTDYWLVDSQLHFATLDESETRWEEHTIPLDELDLQKTVEVSQERGFRFVLRNEPMQQYLQHHPEIGAAEPAPQEPTPEQKPPSEK